MLNYLLKYDFFFKKKKEKNKYIHKQLDLEYLDWWTKYYASLNDKYRNYEQDEIDNDEDQSHDHESEKKSLKSLSIFKKKSKYFTFTTPVS